MDIDYHKAGEILKGASKILLVAHRKPDGDTLGAALALHHYLRGEGKNTTLACVDEPAKRFNFLPGVDEFHKSFNLDDFDLIIASDCGDSKMTNFHEIYPDFLSNRVPILNIDHHASNNMFGAYNLVDSKAASATVIIYRIFETMGATVTKNMAMCLMAGIYNDTGAFMHTNTNIETFKVAAMLMKTGIDASVISGAMFRTKPVAQLRLWGRILSNMKLNKECILSSVVTEEDLQECRAGSEDTGGIVDLMVSISDAQFAMVVTDDSKGFVKGSFRTRREDVDVDEMAKKFGGGGHKKASGFRIPGKLEKETVWKIIPREGGDNKSYTIR